MKIKGKTALVTGAGKRLGASIALSLAEEGCNLALHYRSSSVLTAKLAKEIRKKGVLCRLYKADLARPAAVERLAKKVLKDFNGCDILVNAAAVYPKKNLTSARAIDYDTPFYINTRAPALLTGFIGTYNKKKRKQARIVNLADVGAELSWTGYLPYSLSKAALLQLTRVSALDLAPWVLVNSISPGPMLPGEKQGKKGHADAIKRTALKKYGGADEIANAVIFMVKSDFMTGSNLVLDGGRKLVSG